MAVDTKIRYIISHLNKRFVMSAKFRLQTRGYAINGSGIHENFEPTIRSY
jgi:hypothetical protein